MTTVGLLSEEELLRKIRPLLPVGNHTIVGSGDDCAVVAAPGGSFVVTTDVLVSQQHFREEWSTGFQVGARAAAQNLADIAAMGAEPTALLVSLVLPEHLPVEWLLDLANGLGAEVAPTGAGIVGGDIVRGEQLSVAVTATGYCVGAPIERSGAKPGDTVAVAGTLGLSAAGLAALASGRVGGKLLGAEVPSPFTECVQIYRQPEPPLAAGPLAATLGATAMMDVSDGLVRDAGRIAEASGVTIELGSDLLRADLTALEPAGRALGVDPLEWVLYGGEDHSLLVTFPPRTLVTAPFRAVGVVGKVTPTAPRGLVRLDGTPVAGGWDHFG